MKLVICEKNIAARRISYMLSNGKVKSRRLGSIPVYDFYKDDEQWTVVGLKGHIINLDYPSEFNKWMEIPPHELINIEPCKKVSQKSIATALRTLVDKNPFLIVATDFDREGELIGVEVVNLLKTFNKDINQIKRAKFSSITNYEISNAFNNLTDVDYNLSNAGEARQIIDLVWGAVLTRFISLTSHRLGKDFLSIGRVQSPTLALLVDREKQIKNFVPKTFWKIIARLKKDIIFDVVHTDGQIWDEQKANELYGKVKNAKDAKVKDVKKTVENEYPPPPFNTTSFLQSASYLGFSASKAMSIAEELYMNGLISYPRTDNTVYPRSLGIKGILEKLTKSIFSKEATEVIKNGRNTPTRGKKLTTDHPPIHPAGIPTGKSLDASQQKLYELICRRFLATLAKDAVSETCDAVFDISNEEFKASGYRLIEPNWKAMYPYFKNKKKQLPELKKGEIIKVTDIKLKEDQTKPPSRYSEGSLIAKMEELSLGTKSTRHEIISKLYGRKYVNGSPPVPTSMAFAVVDALEDCDVVKPKMTAVLEEDMSLIADGKKKLEDTVKESKDMLTSVMKTLEKDKDKIKNNIQNALKEQNKVGNCPICGKNLVIRKSRQGKRFVGCSGFPNCKKTYSLPQFGGITTTEKTCKKCNSPMVNVKMKDKKTWNLCLNPDCSSKKSNKTS